MPPTSLDLDLDALPSIMYDPNHPSGTEGQVDGQPVRYVDPASYFVTMLGHRMNVTLVFLSANLPDSMEPDELLRVDEAIARAYWDDYGGCLVPPRVRRLIEAASDSASGELWLASLEQIREDLLATEDLDEATELHALFRVQFLMQGAERQLSGLQVAAGEFLTDYLLLQRASMDDVRSAEMRRERGEPRCQVLERMDRAAELAFERAVNTIHDPQQIAQAIPANRRSEIEQFARNREPLAHTGLLAYIEGLGR